MAIIQPIKLKTVQEALARAGVERMSVCDAYGYARQRGQVDTFRGAEYACNLLRKVVIEVVVNDDFVDRTIDTILSAARSGEDGAIGDGKVFVMPSLEAIQIDNGLRGPEAV
jgi:nitrogen regulatory protein P-II 1